MKVFKRVKYESCSATKPLTSVQSFGANGMRVVVHQKLKKDYLGWWHSDIEVSILRRTFPCMQQLTFHRNSAAISESSDQAPTPPRINHSSWRRARKLMWRTYCRRKMSSSSWRAMGSETFSSGCLRVSSIKTHTQQSGRRRASKRNSKPTRVKTSWVSS